MPGSIVGLVGKQRSGKTLMSYLLAKALYQTAKRSGYLLRCYSNLYSPDDDFMTYISSISDIPLDLDPKIDCSLRVLSVLILSELILLAIVR